MTKEEMQKLQLGDIIRHKMHRHASVVTGNYGDHITAVQTFDVTNPDEWEIVKK